MQPPSRPGLRALLGAALFIALGTGPASAQLQLNGAGATFPYPLYSKWFSTYTAVDPSVRFNYQSIGSGGGIKQLTDRTVDFGASDAPMTDEQLAAAPGPIMHFPTVMGAVVLTYNVHGASTQLQLTPAAVAGIFLGTITKWNDTALTAANPGLSLPDRPIAVIHRSDGSGTTYIFTDYLSKVSQEWSTTVGRGPAVRWPVGLGAKGNEGVTGMVKQTPGSIGYVELIYALSNGLAYAAVANSSGAFVEPSMASVTAAAAGLADNMPEDFRVSLTNAPGADAYPISGMTWLLVYREQSDAAKGKKLAEFLRWMLQEGQQLAPALHYAPLPKAVVAKEEAALRQLTAAAGAPLVAAPEKGDRPHQ